ncbi:uncharacterized protein LOC141598406 [Silene latifolia]|uniref:uncharacterized protein LOC141598406 n=1 Tax=Silene latifolia TaxID=37657 RepID=UPI003D77965B
MEHDKQLTMFPWRLQPPRKLQSLKEHFVHRAMDRRRGVIENHHLGTEIFIEAMLNAVHNVAHFLPWPSEAFDILSGWAFPSQSYRDHMTCESVETVPTIVLGES